MSKKVTPGDQVVGSRVRLRRKQLRMSQETLGEALGITFQQIQKYENGTNRVGAVRLCEISKLLGVPINYFFESLTAVNSSQPEVPVTPSVLAVSGGIELLNAYAQIKNSRMRRVVLDLARCLAADGQSANPLTAGESGAPASRSRARAR